MADWNNLEDDEPSEEVEFEEASINSDELVYFENLISSSSTIVKVYESDISIEEISIVKDSVGAHIIIIHDDDAVNNVEVVSEKVVQDEEGDDYCIVFINENVVDEIKKKISVPLDYQNILKKEDIEHETSTLLAG